MPIRRSFSARQQLALGCALALVAWIAWRPALDAGWLGWDTFPLLASTRAHTPAELLGTLGAEWMDGRYPLGRYWRPVTQLSFALEQALFGLDARASHALDLGLLFATGLVLAALAARWTRSRTAALVAGAYWILHPAQAELLAVPARRGDSLAVLFVGLALLALPRQGPLRPARAACVALACALALGAKESGLLGTLLVLLAWPGPRRAAALAPLVALVGACLLLRAWVLAGAAIGTLGPLEALVHAPAVLGRESVRALLPATWTAPASVPGWLGTCVLLALVLLAAVGRVLRRAVPHPPPTTPVGRCLVPWFLGAALVTALAQEDQAWYALPFVAALAVAFGGLADGALRGLRATPRIGRALGGAALAATLLAGVGLFAGPHDGRARLRAAGHASARVEELLATFDRRLAAARPGSAFAVEASVEWLERDAEGGVLRRVHTLAPYGLEAWAELAHPGRPVRVEAPGMGSAAAPDARAVRVDWIPVPWTGVRAGPPSP